MRKTIAWLVIGPFFLEGLCFSQPASPARARSEDRLSQWAFLKESFDAGPRTVFLLEDIHAHPQAQRNLAAAIRFLGRHEKVRLVCLEGSSSALDTGFFLGMTRKKDRHAVLDYLLERGLLNAAEYAAARGGIPFQLRGVEEKEVYEKNLKAFREARRARRAPELILDRLSKNLTSLKRRLWPESFRRLERTWMDFREKGTGLGALTRLLSQEIQKSQVKEELQAFLRLMLRLRMSNVSGAGRRPMEARELYSELEGLFRRVSQRVLKGEDQKALLDFSDRLRVLRSLVRLELSWTEYRAFLDSRAAYRPGALKDLALKVRGFPDKRLAHLDVLGRFSPFKTFYELAASRNEILVRGLLNRMNEAGSDKAVLIAGGFHTARVAEGLKQRNISYRVLTPRFSSRDHGRGSARSRYEDLLLGRLSPFEKVLRRWAVLARGGRRFKPAPVIIPPESGVFPRLLAVPPRTAWDSHPYLREVLIAESAFLYAALWLWDNKPLDYAAQEVLRIKNQLVRAYRLRLMREFGFGNAERIRAELEFLERFFSRLRIRAIRAVGSRELCLELQAGADKLDIYLDQPDQSWVPDVSAAQNHLLEGGNLGSCRVSIFDESAALAEGLAGWRRYLTAHPKDSFSEKEEALLRFYHQWSLGSLARGSRPSFRIWPMFYRELLKDQKLDENLNALHGVLSLMREVPHADAIMDTYRGLGVGLLDEALGTALAARAVLEVMPQPSAGGVALRHRTLQAALAHRIGSVADLAIARVGVLDESDQPPVGGRAMGHGLGLLAQQVEAPLHDQVLQAVLFHHTPEAQTRIGRNRVLQLVHLASEIWKGLRRGSGALAEVARYADKLKAGDENARPSGPRRERLSDREREDLERELGAAQVKFVEALEGLKRIRKTARAGHGGSEQFPSLLHGREKQAAVAPRGEGKQALGPQKGSLLDEDICDALIALLDERSRGELAALQTGDAGVWYCSISPAWTFARRVMMRLQTALKMTDQEFRDLNWYPAMTSFLVLLWESPNEAVSDARWLNQTVGTSEDGKGAVRLYIRLVEEASALLKDIPGFEGSFIRRALAAVESELRPAAPAHTRANVAAPVRGRMARLVERLQIAASLEKGKGWLLRQIEKWFSRPLTSSVHVAGPRKFGQRVVAEITFRPDGFELSRHEDSAYPDEEIKDVVSAYFPMLSRWVDFKHLKIKFVKSLNRLARLSSNGKVILVHEKAVTSSALLKMELGEELFHLALRRLARQKNARLSLAEEEILGIAYKVKVFMTLSPVEQAEILHHLISDPALDQDAFYLVLDRERRTLLVKLGRGLFDPDLFLAQFRRENVVTGDRNIFERIARFMTLANHYPQKIRAHFTGRRWTDVLFGFLDLSHRVMKDWGAEAISVPPSPFTGLPRLLEAYDERLRFLKASPPRTDDHASSEAALAGAFEGTWSILLEDPPSVLDWMAAYEMVWGRHIKANHELGRAFAHLRSGVRSLAEEELTSDQFTERAEQLLEEIKARFPNLGPDIVLLREAVHPSLVWSDYVRALPHAKRYKALTHVLAFLVATSSSLFRSSPGLLPMRVNPWATAEMLKGFLDVVEESQNGLEEVMRALGIGTDHLQALLPAIRRISERQAQRLEILLVPMASQDVSGPHAQTAIIRMTEEVLSNISSLCDYQYYLGRFERMGEKLFEDAPWKQLSVTTLFDELILMSPDVYETARLEILEVIRSRVVAYLERLSGLGLAADEMSVLVSFHLSDIRNLFRVEPETSFHSMGEESLFMRDVFEGWRRYFSNPNSLKTPRLPEESLHVVLGNKDDFFGDLVRENPKRARDFVLAFLSRTEGLQTHFAIFPDKGQIPESVDDSRRAALDFFQKPSGEIIDFGFLFMLAGFEPDDLRKVLDSESSSIREGLEASVRVLRVLGDEAGAENLSTLLKEMEAAGEGKKRDVLEAVAPQPRGLRYEALMKELGQILPRTDAGQAMIGQALREDFFDRAA